MKNYAVLSVMLCIAASLNSMNKEGKKSQRIIAKNNVDDSSSISYQQIDNNKKIYLNKEEKLASFGYSKINLDFKALNKLSPEEIRALIASFEKNK